MRQSTFRWMLAASCLLTMASPGWTGVTEWKAQTEAGRIAYAKGGYETAQRHFEAALRTAEATFGPEHPDVATSLNNLALLYSAQGRYAEAVPLQQRSLAIYEKALGPEHPHVATSLSNLADLYRFHGRYPEAEPHL